MLLPRRESLYYTEELSGFTCILFATLAKDHKLFTCIYIYTLAIAILPEELGTFTHLYTICYVAERSLAFHLHILHSK